MWGWIFETILSFGLENAFVGTWEKGWVHVVRCIVAPLTTTTKRLYNK